MPRSLALGTLPVGEVRNFLFRFIPPGGFLRKAVNGLLPVADVLLLPFTLLASMLLCAIRMAGVERFRAARWVFKKIGVFPVRDQYYEPMVNPGHLHRPLDEPRELPGIEWDEAQQLQMLARFKYRDELLAFPWEPDGTGGYHFGNPAFGPGDADILYSLTRHLKPRRFIEIGSGHSTLLARAALQRNHTEDGQYECRHVCIEPYESPWLAKLEVELIRERLERMNLSLFDELEDGDILFIDSSHVIRPQGDVLQEYLGILPRLAKGVWVHVHDIFTPRDYPAPWMIDEVKLWNEQYLLEAFLSHNRDFRIAWMMNHMFHAHRESVLAGCPGLRRAHEAGHNMAGGSLWLEKVG